LPPVYGYGPHTEIFRGGKPMKTGFQIFVERALEGKNLEVWGDASRGRDIVYVKDVVDAVIKAIYSKKAVGLYNIASGNSLSLKREAEEIARAFWPKGSKAKIVYKPGKPNSVEPFLYNIRKAKKDLGWAPKYNFRRMIEDYREEMEKERFAYLVEKRRHLLANT
jgi:UDP-glucose 4-epimerase